LTGVRDVGDGHRQGGEPGGHGAAEGRRRMAVRALPAVLLLWAGIVFVLYGVRFHRETVLVPQESKPAAAEIPADFLSQPPSQVQSAAAVPMTETEPQLIREVTIGGVTRTNTGEVKRTYSGKAPSLCPT